METEVYLATHIFEFLEDDFHFDYHLKSVNENPISKSIITYYKDNVTIKIDIDHRACYFNLNVIREKDNSFSITSVLDKLIYQSNNNSKTEFEVARKKITPYL